LARAGFELANLLYTKSSIQKVLSNI
jgi:hypothetical protein